MKLGVALRQLGTANANGAKSMEKLSSGYRINRAGDDAAGLAISEKMRAQVRGLNQASANSQDGISMIQTAEGALTETHAILQRMRELAVQSGNDTNVSVDRGEIQKEMDQLTTEINRIGNTTEFNTQAMLKGDGKTSLQGTGVTSAAGKMAGGTTTHTGATSTIAATVTADATTDGSSMTVKINGQELKVNYVKDTSVTTAEGKIDTDSITGNSVTIKFNGAVSADDNAALLREAMKSMIAANDTLSGSYDITGATSNIIITANDTGNFAGDKGVIGVTEATGGINAAGTGNVGKTVHANAKFDVDFTGITTQAGVDELIGKGITIGDTQFEFYDADKGAYKGNAVGINISKAASGTDVAAALAKQLPKNEGYTATANTGTLTLTSTIDGKAGNDSLVSKDGGVQESFTANFQVGANQGQSMAIEIKDMRAGALGLTGKAGAEGFVANNSVTNGMNNNGVEAALDVSTHEKAAKSITVINDAIEKVSAQRSSLGAFQNRLEHTIKNLDTSSENLQAAESRIRDVDMAKEMMEQTKNNILAQASTAMLAQANQAPQAVLSLLR